MKNNKSLGQHWLNNRQILDEIADLACEDLLETGLCLEIGPGLGTLTSSLLKRFDKVVAVEYDARLAGNLPKSFPGKNLQVVQGDILTVDVAKLVGDGPYAVVGNIPYYITSPIVRKFITVTPRPERIVLLMQKEVAERIAAEAGDHTWISILVQNYARVTLGPVVPAAEFTPPPKVDSQVLILVPYNAPLIGEAALGLAKRGFASPRKKLASVLADGQCSREQWREKLQRLNLNPDARAEDLSLDDWEKLNS